MVRPILFRMKSSYGQSGLWAIVCCIWRTTVVIQIIVGFRKYISQNSVIEDCRMQKQLECHIFGIMLLTAMNRWGWHSQFFNNDSGLALSLKMCTDGSQAFEEVNNSRTFTTKKAHFCFWTRCVQEGMFLQLLAWIFKGLSAEDQYEFIFRATHYVHWNQVITRSRDIRTLQQKSLNVHAVIEIYT